VYTFIRHTDGRVTLRTHVDPEDLPPAHAARLLRGLDPLLAGLRKRLTRARPGPAVPPRRAATLHAVSRVGPFPTTGDRSLRTDRDRPPPTDRDVGPR